ncbi:hypothetical protein AW111_04150 [Escherichia coli]|nr:hypothetical protein BFL20_24295 [Escherichia coli]ASE48224.1 hypothetical protein CEP72_14570 [Escherichia coli O157]ASS84604.1 hypothetical protein A8V32_31920 [Escherichia coli O157:H7]API06159.1 hypothetical protein BFL22_23970 [Escherichia coli]API11710.1 hypothetical protein BFL24_23675 [Escherichia coli]
MSCLVISDTVQQFKNVLDYDLSVLYTTNYSIIIRYLNPFYYYTSKTSQKYHFTHYRRTS